jgi:hypothetical protein
MEVSVRLIVTTPTLPGLPPDCSTRALLFADRSSSKIRIQCQNQFGAIDRTAGVFVLTPAPTNVLTSVHVAILITSKNCQLAEHE